MTKAMKDWLDQEIRQAGLAATSDREAAARMVALAQVRAEVWKLAAREQ